MKAGDMLPRWRAAEGTDRRANRGLCRMEGENVHKSFAVERSDSLAAE